ncbi:hypothetical protein [Mesorhizobium sp.]|uniref:hypothetical protein n=1 Tax=Mesorhizobium sp. TaxID=1871066 RepID=UPI0025FBE8EA|nr:hypothetical protein [Mesorhizobium sp.]
MADFIGLADSIILSDFVGMSFSSLPMDNACEQKRLGVASKSSIPVRLGPRA